MTAPEDLARRAVACSGWRWLAGAKLIVPAPGGVVGQGTYRVRSVNADSMTLYRTNVDHVPTVPLTLTAYPDFEDPATLGCLLALGREAWGAPGFGVVAIEHDPIEEHTEPYVPSCPEGSIWWQWTGSGMHPAHLPLFRSEVEALVCALEAAHQAASARQGEDR